MITEKQRQDAEDRKRASGICVETLAIIGRYTRDRRTGAPLAAFTYDGRILINDEVFYRYCWNRRTTIEAAIAGRALGRSGDGGVDGVIDQDALGLDRVYIQAILLPEAYLF
jgi:Restriction endonuclease